MSTSKSEAIIKLILYYVDDEFRRTCQNPPSMPANINLEDAFLVASRNKLLYYFSKEIYEKKDISSEALRQMSKRIIALKEEDLDKLKATLKFVKSSFKQDNIDFLLVKTLKGLPYSTKDVDIVVKPGFLMDAAKSLKRNGASKVSPSQINKIIFMIRGTSGTTFWKEGLLQIDIYDDFSWIRSPPFDSNFLWERPIMVDIDDLRIFKPSPEADLLSIVAHALFWHGEISLLDFLYIISLVRKNLDMNKVIQQTQKYGWTSPFLALISEIQELKQEIYGAKEKSRKIEFPYLIPLKIVFQTSMKYKGSLGAKILLLFFLLLNRYLFSTGK